MVVVVVVKAMAEVAVGMVLGIEAVAVMVVAMVVVGMVMVVGMVVVSIVVVVVVMVTVAMGRMVVIPLVFQIPFISKEFLPLSGFTSNIFLLKSQIFKIAFISVKVMWTHLKVDGIYQDGVAVSSNSLDNVAVIPGPCLTD